MFGLRIVKTTLWRWHGSDVVTFPVFSMLQTASLRRGRALKRWRV
jgi:hypothetical protein